MRHVPVVLALLAGCATAKLDVEKSIEVTSQSYKVSGANPRRWDAPLAFGPYRTTAVRDGGTVGWSVAVLDLAVAAEHRPYAWTLLGPSGQILDAECHQTGLEVSARGVAVDVQGATGRPVLACAFRPPDQDAAAWRLTLAATADGRYAGELRGGEVDVAYRIRSVHALRGSPLPLGTPAGWEVERRGGHAAVVESLGSGRVLLARAALDGEALAATAAALLLFHPEP